LKSERMKIFVLGLPHTKTLDPETTPFLTCAFTNKVWTLCKMMTERGHEVVHLGTGGSKPICTEQVDVVPESSWKKIYGKRKPTDFYDISEDGEKKAYVDLFARNARRAILERSGPDWTSIVCVTWGGCQWRAVEGVNQFAVESGVGYPNASAKYRAYESYAWLHTHLGVNKQLNGDSWYWTVIPLAVDPNLYGPVTSKKCDYALYLGRIIDSKGVGVACQVARHLKIPLKIVGQGDPGPYLGPGVTYQGPVGCEERRMLLRSAKMLFVPTRYVEPFGGVAVDASMSGCPVVSSDWGAFPETVLHGVTGYRCRTLDHFVWAAQNIGRIDPKTCRRWAEDNFGLDRVALMYEEFFRMVLDVNKDASHDGWKTLRPGRRELGWLEKYYPGEPEKPRR
jgi:glycosyltransferase involved in cell wall biosynthesis